jgi:hypothetical protein
MVVIFMASIPIFFGVERAMPPRFRRLARLVLWAKPPTALAVAGAPAILAADLKLAAPYATLEGLALDGLQLILGHDHDIGGDSHFAFLAMWSGR